MQKTPRGMRLHIGVFGKRNVGKSSLINALVKQDVSIVSDVAGTTTDPVEKPMELLPLGAVLFIDTAGVDDIGALGEKRVAKTLSVIERTDIALIVVNKKINKFEQELYEKFKEKKIPVIFVFSKADLYLSGHPEAGGKADQREDLTNIQVSSKTLEGIEELKQLLIKNAPEGFLNSPVIVSDLVNAGDNVVLVVPIDLQAPKGRLILPQVQTIRELLDADCIVTVVKERELREVLDNFKHPPNLVVTDSQAFLKVAADVDDDIKVTSFSVLFARLKGDLEEFAKGAKAIDSLKSGDKVLIAESCTHHQIGDDIGRVKIPRWLTQYTGAKLDFKVYAGHDFPENVADYKLIIHCGACMTNRREILSRIMLAKAKNIPITNYGLAIAYSLGIFERALKPFLVIGD